jgi:hypothetical protein
MNIQRMSSILTKAVFVLMLVAFFAAPSTQAQNSLSEPKTQVISANPFGLLLDLFNAEYERVIGESTTAGIGGSTYFGDSENYLNADVFWRYYPQGDPLNGWTFGVKAGLTRVGSDGTFFGAGFDVNRSWVMGKKKNFYMGVGFGLKRMYISNNADFDLEYIPTFRLINVGYVF